MASQSGEDNNLDFTGESAEEAQDFVQAVHKRAYAAGRHKDNAWMAEFAFPFFARKALLWYETLDEETQNDWKLLKRAIFAEFTARPPPPATVPSAAPALISSPLSPTPAAPSPSAVTVKIGRIRVDSENHSTRGYFHINTFNYGATVADSSKADIFEVDTLGRTLKFKGSGERLVITGNSPDWPLSPQTDRHGLMKKSTEISGTQWNHTWSIMEDGNITAMLLRTDGSKQVAPCRTELNMPAATEYSAKGTNRSFGVIGAASPQIFKNIKEKGLEEAKDLDGYDELKPEDQAKLDKAWEEEKVADEDIPETARKPAGEEGEDDDEGAGKKRKRKAPAKKKASSDAEEDDEEAAAPKKKAPPRKKKAATEGDDEPKPKKTRAPLKKKAKKVEEEDEDSAEEVKLRSELEDEGEQDPEEEAKAKPAPKKKAPAKKKKKADSDDESNERVRCSP
ncbi:hypothetical protein FRC05_002619 [Tulasnella sp. 425]|nr:hypothetical protein FRC05_002619 [Tulasnella sp. 425]